MKIGRLDIGNVSVDQVFNLAMFFFVTLSFAGYFVFPSGQINNFPTYFVALLVLVKLCTGSYLDTYKSLIFGSILLLLGYAALSISWSTGFASSDVGSWVGNACLVLLMLLAIHSCSQSIPNFADLLFKSIVVVATFSVGSSIFQSFLGSSESIQLSGRLTTDTVAAISYGTAFVISVDLAITVGRTVEKVFWLFCSLLLLLGCVYLGVTYVWLAIVAAAAVAGFNKVWDSRNDNSVFGWILLSIVMMIVFLYLFDLVLVSDRQRIWQSVVDVAYNNSPLFGSGILTSILPHVDCATSPGILSEFSNCVFQHPHNLYVSAMFHVGVVGLGLFLVLILVSVSAVVESDGKHGRIVLSLIGYGATVFLFDGDLFVAKFNFVWLVFWLPIGLAFAMEMKEMKEMEDDEPDKQGKFSDRSTDQIVRDCYNSNSNSFQSDLGQK